MDNDVQELEEEIEILKKRVSILERQENRRKAMKYASIIIKILIILAIAYTGWYAYNYVTNEIPNLVKDQITNLNPFKKN